MSLVAYASSGEESEEEATSSVTSLPQTKPHGRGPGMFASLPAPKHDTREPPGTSSMFASLPAPKHDPSDTPGPTSMFASLPAPRQSMTIQEVEEEPVRPRVKISIPSLADLKDEDAPKPKKAKPAPKGSGLLAMLPEPRNFAMRSLVPQAVRRPPVKPPPPKRPPPKAAPRPVQSESDSSDGEVDFFSLTSQAVEPAEINLEELLPPTAGPSRPPPDVVRAQHAQITAQESAQEIVQEQAPQSKQLSEEAIRALCGPRVKERMDVIEIRGDSMLPDPKDWMLKQMTEEQEQMAHRSSQPSSAHRRKHQITYLAFQAKEREIELKNQWSANRMTKKQTQAKYGF